MRTAICRQSCKLHTSTAVMHEWDCDAAISSVKIMYIISIHIQHIEKMGWRSWYSEQAVGWTIRGSKRG